MRASAAGWIALNELRRVLSDRAMVFFGLLLPVTIIVLIGSAFGTVGEVELGLVDDDGSAASRRLVAQLDAIDGVEVDPYSSIDTLRRDVRTGSIHAGVHLDAGYGTAIEQGSATVDLLADVAARSTGPAIAAVQSAAAEEGVRVAALGLLAEQVGEVEARAAVDSAAEQLDPVTTQAVDVDPADDDVGSFSYTAPANLVLFVFINTFAVGSTLATDRKQGLVRRLVATPHRVGTVLAGLGAAKLLFALVQSALIVGIGAAVFGVEWGDPLGVVVVTVLFAVISTGVGLLAGSLVSDADQAQAIGIPAAVAMGMLGGCMWPLEVVPDAMRIAGHLAPHAWAMDAWTELVFDGAGLGDILPQVGVLVGFAVVVGVAGARQLRLSVVR